MAAVGPGALEGFGKLKTKLQKVLRQQFLCHSWVTFYIFKGT